MTEQEIFNNTLKRAESGDAQAQWETGENYYCGFGVEEDHKKSCLLVFEVG